MDLGTNSARLAVADVEHDGAWQLVVDVRVACRLGQGLASTGRLHPDAEERAMQALDQLAARARQAGAERLVVVATWALRQADNGAAFVARVQRELGLELRVLSGEAEAQLVLRAARRYAAPQLVSRLVCLDLGGGSLELARAGGDEPRLVSLPLGAVVTSADLAIPTPLATLAPLRERTRSLLCARAAGFAAACPEPVAAGGTVTSAARILGRPAPLSGVRLEAAELEALLVRLARLDLEARRRQPGLPPDRADLIVAGLAVLGETLRFLAAPALRVHEQGVREGVLLAMAAGEL